jgi:hypothetical protein
MSFTIIPSFPLFNNRYNNPHRVTFDGPNKLILVNYGELLLDVIVDIYSDWKEWVAEDKNTQFDQAMFSVGGQPLPGGKTLGSTIFLINGWRMRTWEGDHRLELVGNLFTDTGDPVFVPTIGSHNIQISFSTSAEVQGVSTKEDIAIAVRAAMSEIVNLDAPVSSRASQASVEALRSTHQGYGTQFFITPIGDDNNDGLTVATAKATWAGALAATVSGRDDIITYVNPSATPHTHIENVVVDKNNVHLRATSRDIVFKSDDTSDTIFTIGDGTGTNGYSCSMRGLLIDGNRGAGSNTADYCVQVNGKFSRLDALWLKQATLDCLRINGGDYHVIEDAEFEKADRHGISTFDAGLPSGSPREISIIGRSNIYLNDGDGIHLGVSGAPVLGSTTRLIRVLSAELFRNAGYAIHAEAEVDGLTIGDNVVYHDNNGGSTNPQLNILTTAVHDVAATARIEQSDTIWDEPIADHLTAGSTGEALGSAVVDLDSVRTTVNNIDTNVTTIDTNVDSVLLLCQEILKYDKNKTAIDSTAKTLTVFDDDGVTPLKVFQLRDEGGTPSVQEVYIRDPL